MVVKAHELVPILTIADIRLKRGLDRSAADALRVARFCVDLVED